MTIKIECACGTRSGFDVEPENGRMPVPVNCPSCETDITPLADAFIAQNSAPPAPMRVTVRVAGSAPAAPPPPPAPAEGTAAPPPPPPPASSYKAAALQRTIAAATGPKIAGDEEYPDARASDAEAGKLMVWLKRGLAVAGVFLVVWAWYAFYASKPRESYSLTTAEGAPFRYARLLDAERLFILTTQKAAVRNVKSDTELWSAMLAKEEQVNLDLGSRSGGLNDRERSQLRDMALPDAKVRVAGGDIWVVLANKVVRFDGTTGRREVEVPLPSQLSEVKAGDAAIVIVGDAAGNQRSVTRIDLATGKSATEAVAPPAAPAVRTAVQGDSFWDLEFTAAGTGVAMLASRLLERRYVTREGATTESRAEREAKPLIERENLRAADSTEAAAQFLKINQGESVEFDESRHQVTLRRLFGSGAQWSAEVSGDPVFLAAPGVDLLVAGTELRGFDAGLRLLWTLKLSYPAGDSEFGDEPRRVPFAGGGSRLYFFDLGTLTALDPRTGKVQWRLPSVGISQVVPVGSALYVATTSAGPEAIKGTHGVSLNDRVYPVLLKVDAASGKVLWQLERLADQVQVSGKFVYASRAGSSLLDQMSASMNHEDARVQFSARRLDPDTGKELWTWRRNGAPKQFEALDNRLLVRSATEVKLLKFTAW